MFGTWFEVSNHDPRVVSLYSRHYSSKKSKAGPREWLRHGICANGSDVTMLTSDSRALFGWLKQQKRDDSQEGVNCYVFRNEGPILSSKLILDAETIAMNYWHGERLFTFIDPRQILGTNPGYCFKMAGWTEASPKWTKQGLLILEKLPHILSTGV